MPQIELHFAVAGPEGTHIGAVQYWSEIAVKITAKCSTQTQFIVLYLLQVKQRGKLGSGEPFEKSTSKWIDSNGRWRKK